MIFGDVGANYQARRNEDKTAVLAKYKIFTSYLASLIALGSLRMSGNGNYLRVTLILSSQDLSSNSLSCLQYKSYDATSENVVLDQLVIPQFIFLCILITCQLDMVLIL